MYYLISNDTILVPTKLGDEEKTVSVEYKTQDELNAVKQADKFLYYSIPEVFRMKEDTKPTKNFMKASSAKRRRIATADDHSRTSRLELNEEEPRTSISVARQSRISFECHPSLLLQDGMLDCYDDDEVIDPLDLILARATTLQ